MATHKSEIHVGTSADTSGIAKAGKSFADLEREVSEVTLATQEMNKITGDVSPEKLAKMRLALASIEKEAKAAGVDVKGFAKAHEGLKASQQRLLDTQRETKKLTGEMERAKREQKGWSGALFEGGTMTEKLTHGVGLLGAAFGGGFATGVKIAKLAGVDFTETQAVMNDLMTKGAKGIDLFITSMMGLGKQVEVVNAKFKELPGKTVSMVEAANKMGVAIKGNEAAVEAFRKQMERHNDAVAVGKIRADELRGTLGLSGLTTKETGEKINNFTNYLKALQQKGIKPSKAELDDIILTFRELKLSGVKLGAETMNLSKHFGALGKTSDETKEIIKSQVAAHAELTKAMLDENRVTEIGLAIYKRDKLKALEFDKKGAEEKKLIMAQLQVELQKYRDRDAQADLDKGVHDAEMALQAQGFSDARLAALESELLKEVQYKAKTDDELVAGTQDVADRISIIREHQFEEAESLDENEAALHRTHLMELLADERLSAKRRAEIRQQLSEVTQATTTQEMTWERMSTDQKTQYAQNGASAMLSVASQAFGDQKEFAIAQAIMNTYQAATGAYNALAMIPIVGPALGAVAAALAIVAGLKNVEEIDAAQPGGTGPTGTTGRTSLAGAPSFDDPQNDAAARFAGRMSARDVAGHFGGGFREELMSGMAHTAAGNTAGPGSMSSEHHDHLHLHGSHVDPPDHYVRAFTRAQKKRNTTVESKAVRTRERVRK